ncbi:MAG: hypothetical protein ACRCXX_11455 [Cetobacterium sp.]|uniref:hypothetical protein n=1 Tax=Cetobacterium sp. TaxID=2071632 RepID=UPI003F4014E6
MVNLGNLNENSTDLFNEADMPAELKTLLESVDVSLILEMLLGDLFTAEELSEENIEFNPELAALRESDMLTEANIIRLDKNAKRNRMNKLALYTILKKRNPKMFNKLKFVIKMKKSIIALAEKKYGSQAKLLGNAMFRKAASKPKIKKVVAGKGKTLTIKSKAKLVNAADVIKNLNKVKI